jgi:hypothetical protein
MRPRFAPVIAFLVLGALVLLASAACGGDDDDAATAAATSPAAATTAASGPGTITLTSSTIEGQAEKILLVFATSGNDRLARACIPITSDSFEVSGAEMTEIPAQDPCGSDPDVVTFDEGTYQITAGIYEGGQQTAEAETTLTVEVAGDVTAELDGAALSQ